MRDIFRASGGLAAVLILSAMACIEAHAQARTVPQFVGLPRPEVERRLVKAGFAAQWRSAGVAEHAQDRGRIAAQVPPAGESLPSGAPLLLFVYDGGAQPATAAPPAAAAPATAGDCSRWPGSTFDRVLGACRCSEGKWWGFHGDRCEPRERAAGDVCASKWSGSVPAFAGDGTFHCSCPPERPWNAETMECGAPSREASADCQSRWPGTVPVLSPSGTDYECRCPMGMRWEESRARCDASVAAPTQPGAAPSAAPVDPLLGVPPDDENWDEGEPGHLEEGSGERYENRPAQRFEDRGAEQLQEQDAYGNGDEVPRPPPRRYDGAGTPPSRPRDDGAPPPRPSYESDAAPSLREEPADEEGPCTPLLAEIRGRAGAGQRAEADALALRAATKGCDPKAISDAVAGGAP